MNTVKVEASNWNKFKKLVSEKSAIEKAIKELQNSFNLPSANEIAESQGLNHGDKANVIILNGNGDEVGKMSIFYYPGATIPANWRARIN